MSRWTVPTPSRSDPGRATGTATYVFKPRCRCGHAYLMHKDGRLTCSVADPEKCPCRRYEPEEEPMATNTDQLDTDIAGLVRLLRQVKTAPADEQSGLTRQIARALNDLGGSRRDQILLRALEIVEETDRVPS